MSILDAKSAAKLIKSMSRIFHMDCVMDFPVGEKVQIGRGIHSNGNSASQSKSRNLRQKLSGQLRRGFPSLK